MTVPPGSVPGLEAIPNVRQVMGVGWVLVLMSLSKLSPDCFSCPPPPHRLQPGHLSRQQWHALLAESAFLLGLGDPLLGPSALDAVAAGARLLLQAAVSFYSDLSLRVALAGTAFINPAYAEARRVGPSTFPFGSQHPFLEERVGEPHACTVAAAGAQGEGIRTAVPDAFCGSAYHSRTPLAGMPNRPPSLPPPSQPTPSLARCGAWRRPSRPSACLRAAWPRSCHLRWHPRHTCAAWTPSLDPSWRRRAGGLRGRSGAAALRTTALQPQSVCKREPRVLLRNPAR